MCHSSQNHQKTFGLGKDNVDVFAHLWFDEELSGKPFRPDAPQQGCWPGSNLKTWVEKNWKPKKVVYEKQTDDLFKEMYPNWNNAHERLDPVPGMHQKDHQLSMFYGIKKVMEMKQEYERENNFKYDFVVRLRTDFVAVANFGDLEKYDKDKLHVSHYNATALINQYRPGTWVEDLGIAERYIVDIFAMGVSFYQLLTFELPWPSTDASGLAALSHDTLAPTPILEYKPKLHPKLAEAIMACMSVDPKDRPQSTGKFLQSIASVESATV